MNASERRRYFRINDTIGLSFESLSSSGSFNVPDAVDREMSLGEQENSAAPECEMRNHLRHIGQSDDEIRRAITELAEEHPGVAELLRLLNDKMDRITGLVQLDAHLLERVAHRVQEVNISACGLAFSHDEPLSEGEKLRLHLTLLPEETKLVSYGIVVSCELSCEDSPSYYCRVDFYGMKVTEHEQLIQHIVQSQSVQLQARQRHSDSE